jgi:hypothetical protein
MQNITRNLLGVLAVGLLALSNVACSDAFPDAAGENKGNDVIFVERGEASTGDTLNPRVPKGHYRLIGVAEKTTLEGQKPLGIESAESTDDSILEVRKILAQAIVIKARSTGKAHIEVETKDGRRDAIELKVKQIDSIKVKADGKGAQVLASQKLIFNYRLFDNNDKRIVGRGLISENRLELENAQMVAGESDLDTEGKANCESFEECPRDSEITVEVADAVGSEAVIGTGASKHRFKIKDYDDVQKLITRKTNIRGSIKQVKFDVQTEDGTVRQAGGTALELEASAKTPDVCGPGRVEAGKVVVSKDKPVIFTFGQGVRIKPTGSAKPGDICRIDIGLVNRNDDSFVYEQTWERGITSEWLGGDGDVEELFDD